jgi:hypothetical protein
MSALLIRVGGTTARATLLEDVAPKTCEVIKREMPLEGCLHHAKICDNEVFFQVPFFIDNPENLQIPGSGDIGFWNVRQTICIWYDEMEPLGPTNLFARITVNLEGFRREVRKTWLAPGTLIQLRIEE